MLDEITEFSILFDFYGELLSENMREIFRLYHEENLTLSEIAQGKEISRQAVHETVRKAESKLREYESKLGLVARFTRTGEVLRSVEADVTELNAENLSREGRQLVGQIAGQIRRLIEQEEA